MALLSPACYNPTFGHILFKFSLMPMEILAFCVRMHKGRFTWPPMNMMGNFQCTCLQCRLKVSYTTAKVLNKEDMLSVCTAVIWQSMNVWHSGF